MDHASTIMDYNHIINYTLIDPVVRYANWHPSRLDMGWLNRIIPDLQLILCIEGQLHFWYEEQKVMVINPGSLLMIEAGKKHSLKVTQPCIISTFHFEFIPQKRWLAKEYRMSPAPETLIATGDEFATFRNLFELLKNTFNDHKMWRRERLNAIAKIIIWNASQCWTQPHSHPATLRVSKMITYIKNHLKDNINRNQLAKEFWVTPEHINLIFKKELNCTPTEFINRERCLRAGQLLDEGYSVKETCFQVGFKDPAYFSRVFKKHMKVKPKQMKR